MYIYHCIVLFFASSMHAQGWFDQVKGWALGKDEEFVKEVPFSTKGSFTLHNKDGSIKISTWHKPEVMIRATKHASTESGLAQTRIEIQTEAESITVTGHNAPSSSIDFDIIVPKDTTITVNNDRGPVKIKRASGHISVSTDEGEIKISRPTSSVQASANKGSITVKAETFPADGSLFLKTSHGTVTVLLPQSVNATLNAQTRNGVVSSEIPITLDPITTTLTKETRKQLARKAQGTFGSGKGRITIDVLKGDIVIDEV